MGKIIGKSALCFAGLYVANWLIQLVNHSIMVAEKSDFLGMSFYFFLQFVTYFSSAILYPYVLFLLFRRERNSHLIILFNGVFAFVQYYIFWFMALISSDLLYVSFVISSTVGFPTMIFVIIYRRLNPVQKEQSPLSKIANIMDIIWRSALCVIALIVVSNGYDIFRSFINQPGNLGVLLDMAPSNLIPSFSMVYAYALYRLLERHRHQRLLMIINATVLMTLFILHISGFHVLSIIQDGLFSFLTFGHAAVLTVELAFIFKSVERKRLESPWGDTADNNIRMSA